MINVGKPRCAIGREALSLERANSSNAKLPKSCRPPAKSRPHPWSEQLSFGWARTAEWNPAAAEPPLPPTYAYMGHRGTFTGRAQGVMLLPPYPASIPLWHVFCIILWERSCAELSIYTNLALWCNYFSFKRALSWFQFLTEASAAACPQLQQVVSAADATCQRGRTVANSPHVDVLRNVLTFSPQAACLLMILLKFREGPWHWFPSNVHVKTRNLGVRHNEIRELITIGEPLWRQKV